MSYVLLLDIAVKYTIILLRLDIIDYSTKSDMNHILK